jgi:hypothetical protein
MRILARLAVIFALLCATAAHGMYHLWVMNELYSNADGSVQYVEMTALAGQQQYLTGHSLVARSGATSRTFSFPADLPGETTGARMLIATQGFVALNVVTPDYVVPNGFFFHGGGSIDFAGVDIWSHGALPTDGRPLHRDGAAAPASPQNFAGRVGSLGAPAASSFQGLWWRSPAGSESGWGLSVAHEGDVVFAAWFTYDTDGRPLWLVAPEARRAAGDTFAGRLYRTTGPAFSATPWNPAGVDVTDVGSVTIAFGDPDNGTFTYTVGGVTQSRAITRQRLGG